MSIYGPIVGQMRERAKNYLITSEKHEVIVVRGGKRECGRGFCQECGGEVDLFSFDAAIGFAGISGLELARGIETGRIHSMQTSGRDFGVCGRSLEKEKENVGDEEK
jgi:hypothetical protein